MGVINWQKMWQQSASQAEHRAALALLALNGLTLEQIENIQPQATTLDDGWIMTFDGLTYPLTTYAQEALNNVPDRATAFAELRQKPFYEELRAIEVEAHRRLSGAVWYTSEEGQLVLDATGLTETPILPLRFIFPFSIGDRIQRGEVSEVALRSREVLQKAAEWLFAESFAPIDSFPGKLLRLLSQGNMVFVLASTGVSGLNLIHNVFMGRLLSPSDYGQLTFIITLQLLIGLLPTTIQTVTARFAARYHAQLETGLLLELRNTGQKIGLMIGIGLVMILLLASPFLVTLFQMNDVWLLIPMILVIPFFLLVGIDRGILQGLNGFWWLSAAYLGEGLIRLGLGVLLGFALANAGRSLEGAIWALAQSILVTWLIGWLALRNFRVEANMLPTTPDPETRNTWYQLGGVVLLALVGQALITNSDFLLVKNFFTPQEAGWYAAISVLGRIVYFGVLPLTVVLIPMIARRQALNKPTRPIFVMLLVGGGVVCGLLVTVSWLFAPAILQLLYGNAYLSAAPLLAPYALAASFYTITNLVLTYQIALGKGSETWMPLLAGIAQIIGIVLLHQTLEHVIYIQVGLMGLLLVGVLWRTVRSSEFKKEIVLADDKVATSNAV